MEINALTLRDEAKYQLQQIKTIEDGKNYLSKLKTVEVWVKAEKKDAELCFMVSEQKIRTQRLLGGLIRAGQEAGEIASPKQPLKVNIPSEYIKPKTLDEIGLTANESSAFKRIDSIPEDVFENAILEKKSEINKTLSEMTTSGMVALAKKVVIDKGSEIKDLPDDKYNIIYADPPWHYPQDWEAFGQDAKKHYEAMTDEELLGLKVKDISAPDCVLYLWVTSPKLPVGLEILKAWGFDYKTSLIWDKVKHNMGFYASIRHEIILIGGKGQSAPTDKSYANQTDSVYSEARTTHSKKPEYYYDMMEKTHLSKLNRIELFARQSHDGWSAWGNES